MKEELLNTILQVASLLNDCGWESEALWFRNLHHKLDESNVKSKAFSDLLQELDKSISGMGSFSDLPLQSKTENKTAQDLRDQQWDLAEKLGKEIERLKAFTA